MLEFAKKFVRQHWKGVIAVILALVALGLVIAFPEFVIYLGDLVLFGSTPFEFLSLMMLSEIPFFMGLASFFASAFAFLGVLAGSALFNFATYCYNYCYEKVKKFWEKHQTVAILLAALVVVGTIALMVLTQSWIIPVAMVVFHVAAKLMKWLDEKIINPKCDMIRLSVDPQGTGFTPEYKNTLKKQMRCNRSYFVFNEKLFESRKVGEEFTLDTIAVKQHGNAEKQRLASQKFERFKAAFPDSSESPYKVVSELEPAIKGLKDWRASSPSPARTPIEGSRRESLPLEDQEEKQSRPSRGSAPDLGSDLDPGHDTGISIATRRNSRSDSPPPTLLKAPSGSSLFEVKKQVDTEEAPLPSPTCGLGSAPEGSASQAPY